MITDVHFGDDADLIQKILALHGPRRRSPTDRPRLIDVTYGYGRFYERHSLPADSTWDVYGIDERDLDRPYGDPAHTITTGTWQLVPFPDNSFDVGIIDPPFLVGGGPESVIKRRYTSPANYPELMDSLAIAAIELTRVVKPKGVIIIKVMDSVDGRKKRWMSHDIKELWERSGALELKDKYITVGHSNIRDPRWENQRLSRTSHCIFMVFRQVIRRRRRD